MGSRPHMQGTLISLLSQNVKPPRSGSFALSMHLQGTQFKQEVPCTNSVDLLVLMKARRILFRIEAGQVGGRCSIFLLKYIINNTVETVKWLEISFFRILIFLKDHSLMKIEVYFQHITSMKELS